MAARAGRTQAFVYHRSDVRVVSSLQWRYYKPRVKILAVHHGFSIFRQTTFQLRRSITVDGDTQALHYFRKVNGISGHEDRPHLLQEPHNMNWPATVKRKVKNIFEGGGVTATAF